MRIESEKGSILIPAFGVLILAIFIAAAIATQITSTERLAQLPRVRAIMAQVETQVRTYAMSPTSYNCGATGPSSCTLLSSEFAKLTVQSPIGRVQPTAAFDPTTSRFTARIAFLPATPSKAPLSIRERLIEFTIPFEILQPANFQCPSSTPLFAGFKTSAPNIGSPICKAVSTTRCARGEYVSSISLTNYEPICSPAGRSVSCPKTDFLQAFAWNGQSNVSYTCKQRLNPFVDLGFAPKLTLSNTFSSQDFDIADPVYVLPIPEVFTWTTPAFEPANSCQSPLPQPLVNGRCGPADGVPFPGGLLTGLCLIGTASSVSGIGPWNWSCVGSGGGTNASCSAPKAAAKPPVVNGSCGTSDLASLTAAPSSGLCSQGTPSAVAGAGPWTWTCDGSGGGANASCATSKPDDHVDGVCGSAADSPVAKAPSTDLCSAGKASTVTSSTSSFTWQCAGENGGITTSCSVSKVPEFIWVYKYAGCPTGTQYVQIDDDLNNDKHQTWEENTNGPEAMLCSGLVTGAQWVGLSASCPSGYVSTEMYDDGNSRHNLSEEDGATSLRLCWQGVNAVSYFASCPAGWASTNIETDTRLPHHLQSDTKNGSSLWMCVQPKP